MKDESTSFGVKLLWTLIKIAIFILLFPYQILINRKEGRYSVRTLAVKLSSQRKVDEEGNKSHDVTFDMPGFSFATLFAKLGKKKKKKKTKKDEDLTNA